MKFKLSVMVFFLILLFPFLRANAGELRVYPLNNLSELYPGGSGIIVLKIEIPDKSYIYGNPKGPGIGRPTTVEVQRDNFFFLKAPEFPAPKKYKAAADPDFVWIYEKEVKIILPFNAKTDSKPGEYKIKIFVNALLCTDKSCTPHDFTVNYPIRIINGTVKESGNENPIKSLISSDFQNAAINNPAGNGNDSDGSHDALSFKPRFPSTFNVTNIIQAVIFGILAGFILNFMPCVLPVISLKIMDIIRFSGENRSMIRRMGIIFTLGIISSFALLASLASYFGYTWGGLFQHSTFLIAMIALVYVFALSMFNVFAINVPAFAGNASESITNKYGRTFAKGFLATLLATPCSGPFLGGALAWALIQTPVVIFVIFISVGLGMSIPYLILTANPGLVRFIPKPGTWMITFENIMAFLLLGTVVYLAGILQADLIMPTIWFLLFITIAFWQYGKFGPMIMPVKKRIISRVAAVLIIISGGILSYRYFYNPDARNLSIVSEKNFFSIAILFENRDAGKISIVDFTADWCPNCKLVEKTSLYTEKVVAVIKEGNAELLIADMTRENPEAKKLLTALGSRSIPFLAVFPAGRSFYEPICLRDIYSEKDVLTALEIANGSR